MNTMNRLRAFFNPERFQGWGRTRDYFEGWYFKSVTHDGSQALAIIPGIAMDKAGEHLVSAVVLAPMLARAHPIAR